MIRADSGSYSYRPNSGFSGSDQFTYTVSDGTAVSIYTVTVSVGAVNSAPSGQDTTLTVSEDTPFAGNCRSRPTRMATR